MGKRRNRWLSLLLLTVISLQSGCEFKDIDKRFFITAMGIDKPAKGDKKYRVSLKIAIPKGQLQMGQEDYLTLAQDSNSISDAIQKLKTASDKEFDFGHTKVLVLGESLAKADYRASLDWFSRQRFIQKLAWVVVAKPTAESLMVARQKSERLPANALILAFGGQGVESQYIVSQHLYQFYRKYNDPSENPVLPIAEPMTSEKGSYYKIDSVAILDDKKIALDLTPEETKYCNVLNGIVDKSDYMVNAMGNHFTVHANQVNIKNKIVEGKTPTIKVQVDIDGIVEEEEQRMKVSEGVLQKIEKETEKQFSMGATTLLRKLQKQKLDPIGFGSLYRAHHFDEVETEVKSWKALYPKANFQVNVSCTLRAPGAIQ